MESGKSSIQCLVDKIKREMIPDINSHTFISLSPYDIAWLAMIPNNSGRCDRPMFEECLNWVLQNQKEGGFWGDYSASHDEMLPRIECLPSTLACMSVLKRWHVGPALIEKGLEFIKENVDMILNSYQESFPRWFTIIFPAMVELARSTGLEVVFPETMEPTISGLFSDRQRLLERETLVDEKQYIPLLSYLEALPPSHKVSHELIAKHLRSDGSLFHSPSATASAYIATGNKRCLSYIQSLLQRNAAHGVPSLYPVDEQLAKLSMVNQLVRLGLAEHFDQEIHEILSQVHRTYKHTKSVTVSLHSVAAELYKDSLEFWLLRLHGYRVSPSSFCWFINHEEIRDYIEKNYEYFSNVLLSIFRATDLIFPSEHEFEETRFFSRKLLKKIILRGAAGQLNIISPSHHRMIKHELNLPWNARLDHLEHRMWMEEKDTNMLWMGKISSHRLSWLHREDLLQLALDNYVLRQSIYNIELEEVKRWTKGRGLDNMGFGREKTTYCYFAVACCMCLPCNSDIRMLVAKSAIVITVADDFFDMEGSLEDLVKLSDAVQRWDGQGLSGHGKTIFDALDDLVMDFRVKLFQKQGKDFKKSLQNLWHETFASWLKEARWSRSGCTPSMAEYLDVGMTSIAAHTLVLPASCLASSTLPYHHLSSSSFQPVTRLLMITTRLLNDIQSYLKEEKEGKMNYVLLYLKENPEANIEDSIKYVQSSLTHMKKDFTQHVLTGELCDLPKSSKGLHLGCLKVFHMFFNSSNLYDSETDLLQDIKKAIFVPPQVPKLKPHRPSPTEPASKPGIFVMKNRYHDRIFTNLQQRNFIGHQITFQSGSVNNWKMYKPSNFKICFT